MKLRNLLGVLLAAVIAGGIMYFILSRGGGEDGYVTAWYVEGSTAADGFKAAVEDYNAGLSRTAMPVKLTGFKNENALADAFETDTPDILLCAHYRAFDMHARGKLTDISAALSGRVPDYPKGTASRSAAIGKSFFPIGADVQALLINEALCDAQGFETLEALCAATGAEPVCTVGSKFVLYRESEKLRRARNQVGRAKLAPVPVAKSNPVRKGAQARRRAAQAERERRNAYFRQTAIDRAIQREKEKAMGREQP